MIKSSYILITTLCFLFVQKYSYSQVTIGNFNANASVLVLKLSVSDFTISPPVIAMDDENFNSALSVASIIIDSLPPKSDIYPDDYITSKPKATIFIWFKLDGNFNTIGEICSQDNFRDFVGATKYSYMWIKFEKLNVSKTILGPVVDETLWYHFASVFDGTTAELKLYLKGVEVNQESGLGTNFATTNNQFNFAIRRRANGVNNYFHGSTDEVRVYDIALSPNQIQEQIYQEIEHIGGKVHASTIPKDIDRATSNWSNLKLFYILNLIYSISLIDNSQFSKNGLLNNIITVKNQTTPVPYVANTSGTWATTGAWKYGNIWDITSLPNKDWVIVQGTIIASHTHFGLLIDSGSELEIQSDRLLQNISYVKLDEQINLVGESKLILTTSSDFDVISSGYLECDQQGQSNTYNYNYNFWSSLLNTSENNTDYSIIAILKYGAIARIYRTDDLTFV